ncbi:low molecular weight protein arginine phosphatase [Psychrobacillus sp. FSL K6-2365]|jgi:protein-tyrosine phosphatase|uniref:low molecular weight protein arginine phosphatase n=1 Tax=Psychrobacillus TaxID=1221880 RepID=UPI0008EB1C3A|nr:low molecular weight protein arginine phosphatase [Psychrobacillus psychrodurans]MCZ8538976.1 low molecular weight protein arginine phosphatase [Psychrobacillus psychrodurans]SFM26110.1 protein-tyrosine phosphatase [Psychrobacillus psychrodurans]
MNILFVCTGNTCRSPIAEALLKSQNIDGMGVRSAGIYATQGAHISRNSQLVLEKEMIPFTHTSSAVDETLVDWADLILTMTASHKHAIILGFPHAISKVYMYKEFVTPDDVKDVSDPYGGDLFTYENTLRELQVLTDELVKKLQGEMG